MNPSLCVVLLGKTASGKTNFALTLAEKINAEIILLDSVTVYKGFDIGSAKPSKDIREKIPHHLVDIVEPTENFTAGDFVKMAEESIDKIEKNGKIPLIVGGTYFYLRALENGMFDVPGTSIESIEGIEEKYLIDESLDYKKMYLDLKAKDSEAALRIHPNDHYRIIRALSIIETTGKKVSALKPLYKSDKNRLWLKYALILPKNRLNQNIVIRTEEMIKNGLVEETRKLIEKYSNNKALNSIGYFEASQFLKNKMTEKQMLRSIIERTRQLAKRQMTWLRADPEIRFIDQNDIERVVKDIENLSYAIGGRA